MTSICGVRGGAPAAEAVQARVLADMPDSLTSVSRAVNLFLPQGGLQLGLAGVITSNTSPGRRWWATNAENTAAAPRTARVGSRDGRSSGLQPGLGVPEQRRLPGPVAVDQREPAVGLDLEWAWLPVRSENTTLAPIPEDSTLHVVAGSASLPIALR